MPKMIILDLRGDRHGMGLRKMMDDGAFPDNLKEALGDIIPDVFPFEETDKTRDICPGVGFPAHDPIHAILNHLYATAQRPMLEPEVMDKVSSEAKNVMDVDGEFDDDMKQTIMRGSTKVYNRVLDDGTEIKVEVSSPNEKEASMDPIEVLKRFSKRKKASAMEGKISSIRFDVDKFLTKIANLRAASPELEGVMTDVVESVRKTSAVVIDFESCTKDVALNKCIGKVAELTGNSPSKVIEEGIADNSSDSKLMFHGELVDKRKFNKKPFDSYSNAKKALGKQVAELICSKDTGNVEESKLKNLEEFAAEDSLMSKLSDRIVNALRWKE
jgi:hypothetical protein